MEKNCFPAEVSMDKGEEKTESFFSTSIEY